MDALKVILTPVHKEGQIYIVIAAVISLLCFFIDDYLGIFASIISAWVTYFFRDPVRVTPDKEGLIISPADGVVQKIEEVVPPAELEMGDKPMTRVTVFMNVFNVHVNRIPISGTVKKLHYYEGKFASTLDKESDDNERQAIRIDKGDKSFAVVQIAGLVARRIVCYLKEGDEVTTGSRFGIIKFGSRLDVYLPEGINPLVIVGQQSVAGETIIADMNSSEEQRDGTAQ